MGLLFVNACMREGSRTERLARAWLDRYDGEVTEIDLDELDVCPLNRERLACYNAGVATHDFSDELFAPAKQFAEADEILVAAPFWNFSLPAKLHDYLEIACTQGISFDVDESGTYMSLVKARKLTYVTTAGGYIAPEEDDHAFGYIRTLSRQFWHMPELVCVKAEGLDIDGSDVDALLEAALAEALA